MVTLEWVKEHGVTDIGQLTKEEKRILNNAVKRGELIKVKDYAYPTPKTRYINAEWLKG